MTWLDRIFLLLAGGLALYTIRVLIRRMRTRNTEHAAGLFHTTALAVLSVSGILLVVFGWGILGLMGSSLSNRLVAIVATLIPFCWATGIVAGLYPRHWRWFAAFLAIGFLLITLSRFVDMPLFSRIIYPVFHGIAGLTVIILPLWSVFRRDSRPSFALVSLGGLLISIGGLSLSFLTAGRQLLFFSTDFVLAILAPLLFLTTLGYCLGLILADYDL